MTAQRSSSRQDAEEPSRSGPPDVRVSAGVFKGKRVVCPQTGGVRPMLAKTRMALFNVLGDDIRNALVWDCFAGSGLLGLEALSRGASHCVFVEKSFAHAETVRSNVANAGATECATVVRGSIFDFAKPEAGKLPHSPAGLILLDPPHAMLTDVDGPFWSWFSILHETGLADASTVVAVGHPADFYMPPRAGAFRLIDCRVYGSVGFAIYLPTTPPDEEG